MNLLHKIARGRQGQATVEAAYLIPVLMLLLLLLVQPMILLYNRMIMEGAASEACRLAATGVYQGAYVSDKYDGYIKRRLAAIPPIDIFHVHGNYDTWDIIREGDETWEISWIRIDNKLKPLPLLGWGAQLLGLCDADGYLTQEVVATFKSQPSWFFYVEGGPEDWVHNYD